jgi:hypothetical protein
MLEAMPRIITLARACDAVYTDDPDLTRHKWRRIAFRRSGGRVLDTFQGAAFSSGNHVIIAFKGTNSPGDAATDLKLAVGMNTTQYASAATFLGTVPLTGKTVWLCGHSLGGAIAQIIGNRYRLPFATFNAPGVGLISRNVDEMAWTLFGTAALRTAGTIASAVRHPFQAAQDAGAVFNRVRGINFRLGKDVVGCVGVHYGDVVEIPYSGGALDVAAKHRMTTVLAALQTSPYRNQRLEALV